MEVVGEDANTGGADVAAQLDVGLGVFDRGFERGRVRGIEAGRASDADHVDRAVGKKPLDLAAPALTDIGLDAVLVLGRGSHLDPQGFGLSAVGDDGGDVPLASPLVGRKAEAQLGGAAGDGRELPEGQGGGSRSAAGEEAASGQFSVFGLNSVNAPVEPA